MEGRRLSTAVKLRRVQLGFPPMRYVPVVISYAPSRAGPYGPAILRHTSVAKPYHDAGTVRISFVDEMGRTGLIII